MYWMLNILLWNMQQSGCKQILYIGRVSLTELNSFALFRWEKTLRRKYGNWIMFVYRCKKVTAFLKITIAWYHGNCFICSKLDHIRWKQEHSRVLWKKVQCVGLSTSISYTMSICVCLWACCRIFVSSCNCKLPNNNATQTCVENMDGISEKCFGYNPFTNLQ